jgi:hypothetical protein
MLTGLRHDPESELILMHTDTHHVCIPWEFTTACLSLRCVNCWCGHSIELEEEEDDRDNYRLIS